MKKFLTLAIHFPTYCGLLKNILKLKLHNVRLGNHVRIKGQFGIKNRGGGICYWRSFCMYQWFYG